MLSFGSGFHPTALPQQFRPHVHATAFAFPPSPCNVPRTVPNLPISTAPAHVFVAPQPWQFTPAHHANFASSLRQEAASYSSLISRPMSSGIPLVVDGVVQLDHHRPSPLSLKPLVTANGKKGSSERVYSEEEYRAMLDKVVCRTSSARKAASDAGFPSAARTLQRHAKKIRAIPSLVCSTAAATLAAQRAHVASLSLAAKGNADLASRRIFSIDDLDYFARSLKVYADMGWPMDLQALRLMFSHAAKDMNRVDWRLGDKPVVSRKYVSDFINKRPELRMYKASHIDPIRSKKASPQVNEREHCCDVVRVRDSSGSALSLACVTKNTFAQFSKLCACAISCFSDTIFSFSC